MARPKSNHPITETAVKVTRETKNLIEEEKRRWKSNKNEPLDRTIFRVFKEVEEFRKKVKAQAVEIQSLQNEVDSLKISTKRLLKIQRKQAEEISRYEDLEVIKLR
jgi:hypothetical protein